MLFFLGAFMKKNNNLGLWLSLLVIIGISVLPITIWQKALLILLFIGGLAFWKRALLFYVQANKNVISPDSSKWEKAWPLYQKAIRNGLASSFAVTAASMYLQRGDATVGKKIIEDYLAKPEKNKDQTLVHIAKTMVSMAYWMENDLDKAIATVQEVYEEGYRDKNLFINYGTYILEKGDLKTARILVKDAARFESASPGILDNRGWLTILEGNWEEAIPIYETLLGRGPKFPEPYVHAAQIRIHYGKVQEALDLLDKAIAARYSNTSGMKKEKLEELKNRLADPDTRMAAAKEIDANVVLVASGNLPPHTKESFAREEGFELPGFAKESKKVKPMAKLVSEEGERIPNTELTQADIEYAKKHNLE
jgi:Tfp pilus assembly protein PilF